MPLLTIKEAAEILRCSPGTVYAMVAAKKLDVVRVGVGRGKILIPSEYVENFGRRVVVEKPPEVVPVTARRREKPRHLDL